MRITLRSPLEFPKQDETLVQRLMSLAVKIVNHNDTGRDATALVKEFNTLAGSNRTQSEIARHPSYTDGEPYVRICLARIPQVLDGSDEEWLELICRICGGDGEEWETHYWLALMEKNLSSKISDLIYWPNIALGLDEMPSLTPEEILEHALRDSG